MISTGTLNPPVIRHKGWVKITHWIITLSFLALTLSGFIILMCHPRLYWGEAGNDLTPALFELPVSRNYKHGGWENTSAFYDQAGSPVSASRTYEIFNQNGWGRSLHFLAAWFLVITGLTYLLIGILSGHFRKNIWPRANELTGKMLKLDLINHFRMKFSMASGGTQYGLLQKSVYLVVIFFLFPVVVMTGITMSPAITAAYPFLLKIFFGAQSARTIHFFASFALVLFLIVHIVMVIRSGFKQQMRSMTIGK
ncbi:MAG: cytochrome b/b6 domain-containing protein [Chitinophagaceae bacterium]